MSGHFQMSKNVPVGVLRTFFQVLYTWKMSGRHGTSDKPLFYAHILDRQLGHFDSVDLPQNVQDGDT